MRKVIKIFFGVVSGLILGLIIVPIIVCLALMLPSVQNFAVRKAAAFASDKLQTTVSIDRIDLQLFSTAKIKGFYVQDYEGDTLLYVRGVDATLNVSALLGGNLSFDDVRVDGVRFNIRQNPDSTTNLKLIIDKIRRAEPRVRETPFKIGVMALALRDMEFSLKKQVVREREYGMNFDDFRLQNVSLDASNIRVIGDSVMLNIRHLSVDEKNGFSVSSLSTNDFMISGRGMRSGPLALRMPDSSIDVDYVRFVYSDWPDFGEFVDRVEMHARVVNSQVSFRTIGFFAPNLRNWQTNITDLNATINGTVKRMSGELQKAYVNETFVRAKYKFRGLPDVALAEFEFTDADVSTTAREVKIIMDDIKPGILSDSIMQRLDRMRNIELEGNFKGSIKNFAADAALRTAIGSVTADIALRPGNDKNRFSGQVIVSEFDAGAIAANDNLGRVWLNTEFDGSFGGGDLEALTTVRLNRLEFNDYAYRGITLRGVVDNLNFKGEIISSDPNIDFNFDGILNFNDSIPRYDFALALNHADLSRLNFNKRDSISRVKASISARGSGFEPDNLNADIVVDDLFYINHIDSLHTGTFRLKGRNNDERKYLSVTSDFIDVEFRSKLSYKVLYEYFTNTLAQYLPSLTEDEMPQKMIADTGAADISNYSLISVNVKSVDNIVKAFVPGLIVAEGTHLNFMFNPQVEQFRLTLNSDYIEKGNMFLTNLDINSLNQGDSISVYLRTDEVYAGGFMIPGFSVLGGIKDNRIYAATRFKDEANRRSALIGSYITLGKSEETGQPQLNFRTSPSYFEQGDQRWNIFGMGTFDSTRIQVRNLGVEAQGQLLRARGVIAAGEQDTLHVDLRNFDLAFLSQFGERLGYYLEGKTNGHIDLISLKNRGRMQADIQFDSIRVNNYPVPSADFTSTWDFQQERARFMLKERATADTVLTAYYRPADNRYMGRARFKRFNVALLEPFFNGILRDTRGVADANVTLSGQGKDLRFSGEVELTDMKTTVDFLNVPYTLPDAVMQIEDNVMRFDRTQVLDPHGNRAELNLKVDLSNFQNINYDINIRPENLLVMNTDGRAGDMFYGRVFASGLANISGDRRGINMNITAETAGNSDFYFTLDDKSDLADADFLFFITPPREQVDSTTYEFRRQQIMDRRKRRRRQNTAGYMNIDLNIRALPNLAFHLFIDPSTGHGLTARGNGTLNMDLDPRSGEFSMRGNYELTEGVYRFNLENFLNKNFQIESGSSIQFEGSPLDATLNIAAIYRVKTALKPLIDMIGYSPTVLTPTTRVPIDCRIMLTESLSQPVISFDITNPIPNTDSETILSNALNTDEMKATQFFYLIATGAFQNTEGGIGGIDAKTTGASTAIDFLSNQVSNWVSNDKFNIGFRYTVGDERTGSDELGIDFSQQFFSNRLLIEAEGNYETVNYDGLDRNPLSADFYITYLIDKNGNLKTKAFSRRIDRYDENKDLQESGIGIYYNEYFDTYRDIGRNLKETFTGARRRRQRAAQEEADRLEREMLEDEARRGETVVIPVEAAREGLRISIDRADIMDGEATGEIETIYEIVPEEETELE